MLIKVEGAIWRYARRIMARFSLCSLYCSILIALFFYCSIAFIALFLTSLHICASSHNIRLDHIITRLSLSHILPLTLAYSMYNELYEFFLITVPVKLKDNSLMTKHAQLKVNIVRLLWLEFDSVKEGYSVFMLCYNS